MLHFDPVQVIGLLVGVVLPLITGLITKTSTSPGVKAVILLALSALTTGVASLGDALANHVTFDLGTAILAFLTTFLFGVGSHFGLWAPTGASAALQRVGSGQRSGPGRM
jgi:small basic protein